MQTNAVINIEFASCRRENLEIQESLIEVVSDVCRRGTMLQGPEVSRFEEAISGACGRRYCVCVGSGTDALYFSLKALGIGPGDEVLVPDVSFIASASAVSRTGARPVFIDIDSSCNLDLGLADSLVTARTRAMLFVQLFGGMGDPDAIESFGSRHDIAVVEDGAQSFGAAFGPRACGSVGDVSALSFDPMKVLAAPGSGGAVLTDDPALASRVRRLRYHGREAGRYVELGHNSQLSSIAAAVLLLKLEHHTRWTERRRQIAKTYIEKFSGLPIAYPRIAGQVSHVWHKFILTTARRDPLACWLNTMGVPAMIHYPWPLHLEPMFSPYGDENFPRACAHANMNLSLPIHAHLTDTEINYITDAVVNYFRSLE